MQYAAVHPGLFFITQLYWCDQSKTPSLLACTLIAYLKVWFTERV